MPDMEGNNERCRVRMKMSWILTSVTQLVYSNNLVYSNRFKAKGPGNFHHVDGNEDKNILMAERSRENEMLERAFPC
jgi:hypothetical protein